jgi:probable selenium-dependent hydroxylase accessory protein YqeC
MAALIDCLNIRGQQVISLIGSGGKTSLMWYLAKCHKQERVLVSTTTKIGCPITQPYDFFYSENFANLGSDGVGITLAGLFTEKKDKLAMPPTSFRSTFKKFDKVFLEADGSKQLPLKGWETFEPVILPETSMTIGIVPITALRQPIDANAVHRLPLFLRATGATEGQLITEKIIAEIIASPTGLWSKCQGQRILCINQVESATQLRQAKKITSLLPKTLLTRLSKVVACNIQSQEGVVLWSK